MKNSTKFINIYNKLDDYMRDLLNEKPNVSHNYLIDTLAKKNSLFKHYKNDLKEFAQLRNAIVHNTHFLGSQIGEIIAEPVDGVIELYEDLLNKVMKPKCARDMYRKIDQDSVLTAKLDNTIIEIIKIMYQRKNTCVPIIEKRKLVGVFSENVLLTLIAKKGFIDCNNIKMKDIINYIDIDSHHGEYFEFCKINDNYFTIKELFQENNHKRLEMIFVTANGKRNEEILGVISAWDVVLH